MTPPPPPAASGTPTGQNPDAERRLSALRHDLRNDLATALLAADLLSNDPDERVKRHAATIIAALEKATDRLRQSRSRS
ncbi:histidine kinase dimerization/phospho-acceptor domain-containing protein [Swaminathania salitolerans]|uniref:histidine kinase n=1 Tax=Swaminathania salitolerans TaxID=182838 RepID=A0A511BME4_9PROT|nr:histidine kinase dimerization/phospho-acceptor domain-containing protein [Swaminathania salitolerans]GBQ15649.1 hypothetical protein AA21291_2246 [Swaminathania salitolerans LMG 21291]GEL01435.1 hypothetical protein SSA02_05980 [Swaminathania salitolerans]